MTQLIKQSWTSYPKYIFLQACRFSPINKLKYEENIYKCYYCGIKESSLQSIIEHCKQTKSIKQLIRSCMTWSFASNKNKKKKAPTFLGFLRTDWYDIMHMNILWHILWILISSQGNSNSFQMFEGKND
jgi:hypothetical protein